MKLQLVPNAWRIFRYAWSIRFIAAAFVLTVLEVLLPLLDGWVSIPHGIIAAGAALSAGAAFVARLVAQAKISGVNIDA